jgi:Fe-Mn family superoxide dismutase
VQGSGWGARAWEPLRKLRVVEQVYVHQGNIGNGTVPLLVVDMWEQRTTCTISMCAAIG